MFNFICLHLKPYKIKAGRVLQAWLPAWQAFCTPHHRCVPFRLRAMPTMLACATNAAFEQAGYWCHTAIQLSPSVLLSSHLALLPDGNRVHGTWPIAYHHRSFFTKCSVIAPFLGVRTIFLAVWACPWVVSTLPRSVLLIYEMQSYRLKVCATNLRLIPWASQCYQVRSRFFHALGGVSCKVDLFPFSGLSFVHSYFPWWREWAVVAAAFD